MDMGFILGGEDPLEKENAIHSSIPAWKIPWTEETGGLQFMGSQRVKHDEWLSMSHVCVKVAKKIIQFFILLCCEDACFAIYLFVLTTHTKYILD